MRLASLIGYRTAAAAVALTSLMFAGAAEAQEGREVSGQFGNWLPPDVSTHGHGIDTLFNVVLWLTGITCIGVFIVMLYFLVKYRHRPGRQATFIHGNNKLETVWTLIPTVIMALIAVFSQSVWSTAKYPDQMPSGDDVVYVDVIGKQFAWYFHYPGADGKFGPLKPELANLESAYPEEIIGLDRSVAEAKDDIVAVKMVVPVNKKIRSRLASVDVLHSFFLPNFRVKQDAVPGLRGNVWFEATKTSAQVVGIESDGSPKPFDIVCAELCGQGHFKMKGMLYVVTQSEYEQFLEEQASYLDFDDDD